MSQKSIKLSGNALKAARRIVQLRQDFEETRRTEELDLRRRLVELGEQATLEMRAELRLLFEAVGIPSDEEGEWTLDTKWLKDHGCAFLENTKGICPHCGDRHDEDEEEADHGAGSIFEALAAGRKH